MRKIIGFVAIALVILVPSLVGCAETQYQPGQPAPSQPATTEKLQILSHSMSRSETGTFVYIKGTAKNVSSSRLSFASVNVKFYDADGTLLDTSLDVISDLDPGETWSFEVGYYDEYLKYASYKIGVGSTW
jgi:hypothetical protein